MKKPAVVTDPDLKLWTLLRQARDAIQKAREKELRKQGISSRQAAILHIIETIGDRATPAEIARWQFREAHSVSGILSRMEKDGLVKKTKDMEPRNLVRITVTPRGRRALAQTTKRESFHRIMSYLTDEERQDLITKLERLRDEALKELGIVHKIPYP